MFSEVQDKLVNFMTASESDPPAFSKHLPLSLFRL